MDTKKKRTGRAVAPASHDKTLSALAAHQTIETNNRGNVLVSELKEGDQLFSLGIPWDIGSDNVVGRGSFSTRQCISDLTTVKSIHKLTFRQLKPQIVSYGGPRMLPLVVDPKCNSIVREFEPHVATVEGLNLVLGHVMTDLDAGNSCTYLPDSLSIMPNKVHTMWEQPYFTGKPLKLAGSQERVDIGQFNTGWVSSFAFARRLPMNARVTEFYVIECSPYNHYFCNGLLIFTDLPVIEERQNGPNS